MSELIDRNVLKAKMYQQEAFESDTDMQKWDSGCWIRYKLFEKVVDSTPTVPYGQRWHRVEEPPKEHGKYPVCWFENGNFYWQEAHYCYYQDGDKWVAWSSYQGDDVEITPDYWMPIEPPKEDA